MLIIYLFGADTLELQPFLFNQPNFHYIQKNDLYFSTKVEHYLPLINFVLCQSLLVAKISTEATTVLFPASWYSLVHYVQQQKHSKIIYQLSAIVLYICTFARHLEHGKKSSILKVLGYLFCLLVLLLPSRNAIMAFISCARSYLDWSFSDL